MPALATRKQLADSLLDTLRKLPGKVPSEEEFEREVDEFCVELWERDRRQAIDKDPSLRVIPRLFFKRDFTPNSIAEQTRREARIRLLKRQEMLLLEQADLELCHELLLQNAPGPPGQERINYDGFCQVRSQLPEKFEHYFAPQIFMYFSRDSEGQIPILPLYQFVVCRDALLRKRITLGWYDYTGAGFLRETDLENFVQDEISNSPILSQLEKSFQTFYVCTAVRMLLFFLDPSRRGKIRIRELIKSPILDDLLALRQVLPEEDHAGNWFSPSSAKRVYGLYLQLDLDGNGMLSQQELLGYEGAYLTEVFVQRVFEECQTYDGEMDFKSFLDFVLAMENRSTRPAMTYFFRLLDIRRAGCIGSFEINYFFKHVLQALKVNGHPEVDVDDVKDEIFDMVRPENPDYITLEDIVRSHVGETVISILIDMHSFYQYDNRESIISQQAGEDHV